MTSHKNKRPHSSQKTKTIHKSPPHILTKSHDHHSKLHHRIPPPHLRRAPPPPTNVTSSRNSDPPSENPNHNSHNLISTKPTSHTTSTRSELGHSFVYKGEVFRAGVVPGGRGGQNPADGGGASFSQAHVGNDVVEVCHILHSVEAIVSFSGHENGYGFSARRKEKFVRWSC